MNSRNDLVSTAHIVDVSSFGGVMDPGLSTMWPGAVAYGPAFTVRTAPGDNASLHEALNEVGDGDILVVDGQGYMDRALWGGIMSEAAVRRGVVGLVVDGAVRDVADIRRMGFPVFARGRTPATPYKKVRGHLGGQITCGGVVVNPGDWIHADDDGVVVIQSSQKEDVLSRALVRHELEERILAGLASGQPLGELLSILKRPKDSQE